MDTELTLLVYYVFNIYLNFSKLDDGSGHFGGAIQQNKRRQVQRTIHVKAVLLVRLTGIYICVASLLTWITSYIVPH